MAVNICMLYVSGRILPREGIKQSVPKISQPWLF